MKTAYTLLTALSLSLSTICVAQTEVVEIEATSGDQMEKCQAADIDNDGIKDLVMVIHNDLVWYRCDASGYWSYREIIYRGIEGSVFNLETIDVNADGFQDFYISAYYEKIFVINPGAPGIEWVSEDVSVTYPNTIFGFLDADGDTDDDIVVRDVYYNIGYFENTAGSFVNYHILFAAGEYTNNRGLYDINSDGAKDILIADYSGNYTLLLNNLDGTVSDINAGTFFMYDLHLADVNGDGFGDITYRYAHLYTRLWDNTTETFSGPLLLGDIPTYNFFTLNVDGDADADLLYLKPFGTSFQLYVANNTGLPDPATAVKVIDSIGHFANNYFTDINFDNRIDLIEGEQKILYAHLQNPDGTFATPYVPDTLNQSTVFSKIADINGDGINDLMHCNENGAFEWLEYAPATNTIIARHSMPFIGTKLTPLCMNVIDIDLDGDLDVLTSLWFSSETNKYLGVFTNNGSGTFSKKLIYENAYAELHPVDADEDGDLDIVALGKNGYVYIFPQTAAAPLTFGVPIAITAYGYHSIDFMDVNGDSLMDIVAGVGSGDIRKLVNITPGYYAAAANLYSTTCSSPKTIFTDDYDGDGDDDVIFSCYGYYSYIANNNDGVFTEIPIGSFAYASSYDITTTDVMDVDADGFSDLVLEKYGYGMYVKHGSASGFANEYIHYTLDMGTFENIDDFGSLDFIGSNTWSYYIQYNAIINPSKVHITHTAEYLEEEGAADIIQALIDFVPAEPLTMHFTPDSTMNIGAGKGIAVDITFPSDSTALNPVLLSVWLDDADTIPEKMIPGNITITTDETWGMGEDYIDTVITYALTDNDAGIFLNLSEIYAVENGTATNLTFSCNIYQPLASSFTIYADLLTDLGLGNDVNKTISIPAGIGSVQTYSVPVNSDDDHYDYNDTIQYLQFDWTSAIPEVEALIPDAVTVFVTDDDSSIMTLSGLSDFVHDEGDVLSIKLKINTAPFADVTATITPDMQLDLGNGPGQPVNVMWYDHTYATAYKTTTATIVEDMIPEGLHTSTITFTITSDDPHYNSITIPDQVVNIDDALTGIADASLEDAISVQPSVTTNFTTIVCPETAGNCAVFVFDISGQKILSTQGTGNIPLDLSGLSAGQYLLRLQFGATIVNKTVTVVHN